MILNKFWRAVRGQLNKLGNLAWSADPIAQMQYECDAATLQLKQGREGLEQYRALVERVGRQVDAGRQQVQVLEGKIKAWLSIGDREAAAREALALQTSQRQLHENEALLEIHERNYEANVAKIKQASRQLAAVRDKIQRYDAELKMSGAEAEIARLAGDLDFDVTTDFGQIEQMVNDKIQLNHARVRVTSDLAAQPAVDLERQQALEAALGQQALAAFEAQHRLAGPAGEPPRQLGAPSPADKP